MLSIFKGFFKADNRYAKHAIRTYDLNDLAQRDSLPLMSGDSILKSLDLGNRLTNIKVKARVTNENFDEMYYRPILKLVESAQLAPASESYHHYELGGFVVHTLEVIEYALAERDKYMLPEGGTVEQQTTDAHKWTYAAFVCALLHDVGKLSTQHTLRLNDGSVFTPFSKYSDFIDSQNPSQECSFSYNVEFNHHRVYETHERMGLAFMGAYIGSRELNWLAADKEVFNAIVEYLSGHPENSESLARIIKEADSRSTGDYIKASKVSPFIGAIASLQEEVWRCIRSILQEEIIHGRHNKVGGMVQLDGSYVYINAEMLRIAYAQDKGIPIPPDGSKEKTIFANKVINDFANTGQFKFFAQTNKQGVSVNDGIITSIKYYDPKWAEGVMWRGQIVTTRDSILGVGNTEDNHPSLTKISQGSRYILPVSDMNMLYEYCHWRKSLQIKELEHERHYTIEGMKYYLEQYGIATLNNKEFIGLSTGKHQFDYGTTSAAEDLEGRSDTEQVGTTSAAEDLETRSDVENVGTELESEDFEATPDVENVVAPVGQDEAEARPKVKPMLDYSTMNIVNHNSNNSSDKVVSEGISEDTNSNSSSSKDTKTNQKKKTISKNTNSEKKKEKGAGTSFLAKGMSLIPPSNDKDEDCKPNDTETQSAPVGQDEDVVLELHGKSVMTSSNKTPKKAKESKVAAKPHENENKKTTRKSEKLGGNSKNKNENTRETRKDAKPVSDSSESILDLFPSTHPRDKDIHDKDTEESVLDGGIFSRSQPNLSPSLEKSKNVAGAGMEKDLGKEWPKTPFESSIQAVDLILDQEELLRRMKVELSAEIYNAVQETQMRLLQEGRLTFQDMVASLKQQSIEVLIQSPYSKSVKDRSNGIESENEYGDLVRKVYAWDIVPLPALPSQPSSQDYGKCFLQWLCITIFSRKYEVNKSNSPIHKIRGMYLTLLTPVLFLQFLSDYGLYEVPNAEKSKRESYNKDISTVVRNAVGKIKTQSGKDIVQYIVNPKGTKLGKNIFTINAENGSTLFHALLIDIKSLVEYIEDDGLNVFMNGSFEGVLEGIPSNSSLFIQEGVFRG